MPTMTKNPIVHSYDVTLHRVRCGAPQADRSTKHPNGVTCAACRELLLDVGRTVARRGVGDDATIGR